MTSTQPHPQPENARSPQRFAREPDPAPRGSFGRALAALLTLLALLVGVPVGLWLIAGPPPVPTGLPDRHDLAQPLDAELLVAVLLAVVWLAWLQFAVCTLVEIVSFVQGGGLPRAVPLSGHSQAVARALVGTALVGLSFLASTGAASAVTTDGEGSGAGMPPASTTPAQAHSAQAHSARAQSDQAQSHQAHADQARTGQAHWGQAHSGQVGPDPAHTDQVRTGQADPGLERTGQERTGQERTGQVPAPQEHTGPTAQPVGAPDVVQEETGPSTAPTAGVPREMTDVIGHKVAIVQAPQGHYHDNLWDIAERHLGDGRRWKEIYDLNKGRTQPDGEELVLGRLIQPGWVLIMPNDAVGVDRVQPAPQQQDRQQDQRADRQQDQRAEQQDQRADQQQDQQTAAERGRLSIGDWPEIAPQAQDEVLDADPHTDSPLASDLTQSGLLGASVLAAVLLERRRRRGAALGAAEAEAEVALRIGADPDRATWLDAALRSLSAGCRSSGIPLPPVYAVTVSADDIELRLAAPQQQAPEGWRVAGDGRAWLRGRGHALPAERGHAPYPGLVCLGRDDDGRDVLVDLEAADGIVSVQGSPTVAREVVAAMAVQLATAPWADDQRVLGHDLGEALVQIGQGRLELLPDLAPALDGLARSEVQQPAGSVLSGRLGRAPGSTPHYVVLGSMPDHDVAGALGRLTREGSRGLGIVVAGTPEASRWQASVDDAGRLSLPLLGLDLDAVRLGPASTDALARLFERAHHDEPATAEGRPLVPASPQGAGDDAHWSTARVRVGILGALEVRTTGEIDEARLPLATEFATFLALQDGPVHRSVLGASIWPMGVTADVRDATIGRVRDWLGTDADGNHLLSETDTGRLHLAPAVAVDWHAFCTLVQRSHDAVPRKEAELLRRALQLVRGPLLHGVPQGRFAWMARTGIEREAPALVESSAHRLVELCGQDPSGAAAAARAGLRLVPQSQVLWRDLLVAEGRQDPAALATAAEHMLTQLHAADVPVEPETAAMLDELLPAQGGQLG